jgi:hypothetical protein
MAKFHTLQTGKEKLTTKANTYWGNWLDLNSPPASKQDHLDEHSLWQLALNAAMFQTEPSK